MADALKAQLILATTKAIQAEAERLTTLDQAIGDGDHGHNMRRGFEAIAALQDELAEKSWGEALQKAGLTLVMKVGGASGPLYGSLLMAMGKAAPITLDAKAVAAMLATGIEAVKARGKATTGEKTLLDVLVPVQQLLQENSADPLPQLLTKARLCAEAAREATKPLQATKGRASFLGPRSIGHVDPGAHSSALLISVVCDLLAEGKADG